MNKIKLGDVLEVKRGMSLPGEYYATEGDYIRLTLGNFNYPSCGWKKNVLKDNLFFTGNVRDEYILKKGDIITPLTEQVRGLLGNTATIPEDALYIQSGDIGLIIPDETKLDKRFSYYLVSSSVVKKQLDARSQQTKIRHTSPEAIKDCVAFIPIIKEQKKISYLLDCINKKIENNNAINDNLEATAQAYFDNLFFSCDDTDCTLADIALVNPSRPLSKGVEARCFDMSTLPTSGCIPTGDTTKPYNGGVRFINGDTLIARITPCLENGKAAYINILNEGEVAFGSTEYIVFASKDDIPSCFYYFLIRNSKFVTFALQFMNGSSGRQRVSGEELASFPLMIPSKEKLAAFNKVGKLVLEQMKESTEEIQFLKQLQETITATLSSN